MAKPNSKFRKNSEAYWERHRALQKINARIRAGKSFHDLQKINERIRAGKSFHDLQGAMQQPRSES